MQILYTPKFSKLYKKLPAEIKGIAEERELIFIQNPFDQRLKTHKLHGKFDGLFAFSLNHKYRIIFSFEENQKNVRFLAIGSHDIYE